MQSAVGGIQPRERTIGAKMELPASGPTSRVYFSQRLRLHYVDWGNPTAPPLVLLHGGRDHCAHGLGESR